MTINNQAESENKEAKKFAFFRSQTLANDKAGMGKTNSGTKKSLGRWWVIVLLIVLILLLPILIGSLWVNTYKQEFENASGVKLNEIVANARSGWDEDVFGTKSNINFLLFGVDSVKNRQDGSTLTDSIVLVSINKSGKITLISIPRDLWISRLKTKVNALYYYGEISDETTGEELLSSVVEEISGEEIDFVMKLNLEDVSALVDAMNGVEINVEKGFVDERYPRSDVDLVSSDESKLFETVVFESGMQRMNGETVLKYIRSRQSDDLESGTDLARSQRQQQVMKALVDQLQTTKWWLDPVVAGGLYANWSQLEKNIDDKTIVGMAKYLYKFDLQMEPHTMTDIADDENGILTHPPVRKYGQWVYEPTDPTWTEMTEWFMSKINS